MNKIARFLCDPIKLLRLLIGVALGVGILMYVWYQVSAGLGSDIETETAMLVEINDSIDSTAYIFRDEATLDAGSGILVTVVSEGERVSKGQLVANVYLDEDDAVLQDEINRINRRIEIIDESFSHSGIVSADVGTIEKNIEKDLFDVYKQASEGNMSFVIDEASELIINMNKKDFVIETSSDYSDELENLIMEKNEIEDRIDAISTPVYSNESGYFYGSIDGYESKFTIEKAEELTVDSLNQLAEIQMNDAQKENSVKIVKDFVWYLACSIDVNEKGRLKEGRNYSILFPENGETKIVMNLERIESKTTSPTAVAVFRANVLPSGFNFKRKQSAKILLGERQGLAVPKKAIRFDENNVPGVYILVGDVVRYRSCEIIDQKDNYYIVSADGNDYVFEEEAQKKKVKSISLYDNVITSGKDLFDGKIVG